MMHAAGILLFCQLRLKRGNHFQNEGHRENGTPRFWMTAGFMSAGLHFAALSLAGH
jgi:hypothetical protein